MNGIDFVMFFGPTMLVVAPTNPSLTTYAQLISGIAGIIFTQLAHNFIEENSSPSNKIEIFSGFLIVSQFFLTTCYFIMVGWQVQKAQGRRLHLNSAPIVLV